MKTKRINFKYIGVILLSVSSIALLSSCDKEIHHGLTGVNGSPPSAVTNVVVQNIHGGAIIHYEIPKSPNLFYVEAVYHTNGKRKKGYQNLHFIPIALK